MHLRRRPRQLLPTLAAAALLALAVLCGPQVSLTQAYLCTNEPEIRGEGEPCGGPCNELGACAEGLECLPPPPAAAQALEEAEGGEAAAAAAALEGKLRDVVDHLVGHVPTGVCARPAATAAATAEAVAARERELAASPFGGGRGKGRGRVHRRLAAEDAAATPGKAPCAGCPAPLDPASDYVVEAGKAAVALMKEGGFFAGAQEGEIFELARVVQGTSQVVSGIRYAMVVEVKRTRGGNTNAGGKATMTEYYEVDLVSQPWVDPPYRLLKARPLTAAEIAALTDTPAKRG